MSAEGRRSTVQPPVVIRLRSVISSMIEQQLLNPLGGNMKFAKMVSAGAVAFAALAALGSTATASAAPNDDVSVLAWRVVAGPYPGNEDGLGQCERAKAQYRLEHNVPAGCL